MRALTWVEPVAHRVPQHVERQHDDRDGNTCRDAHHRLAINECAALVHDLPPAWPGHAEIEERQARLGEDVRPIEIEKTTMIGSITLGNRCLTMMRVLEAPMLRAASMNTSPRVRIVAARMIREAENVTRIDSAIIVSPKLRSPTCTISSRRTSGGNAIIASTKRWSTRSNLPPASPEMRPMMLPRMQPKNADPTPIGTEIRDPWMRRVSRSRPRVSVPSQ